MGLGVKPGQRVRAGLFVFLGKRLGAAAATGDWDRDGFAAAGGAATVAAVGGAAVGVFAQAFGAEAVIPAGGAGDACRGDSLEGVVAVQIPFPRQQMPVLALYGAVAD